MCEKAGADLVFTPTVEEMYPKGYSTYVTEELISKPLCGISRPAHFRGVTTIVAKLFNIVRPDLAVFGQKDAQQVAVIKKMVNDLHFCIDIVTAPTVREPDGLAMSSRNRNLTASQRTEALAISQALHKAKEMVDGGVHNADRLDRGGHPSHGYAAPRPRHLCVDRRPLHHGSGPGSGAGQGDDGDRRLGRRGAADRQHPAVRQAAGPRPGAENRQIEFGNRPGASATLEP